jgi:hypothetical protein
LVDLANPSVVESGRAGPSWQAMSCSPLLWRQLHVGPGQLAAGRRLTVTGAPRESWALLKVHCGRSLISRGIVSVLLVSGSSQIFRVRVLAVVGVSFLRIVLLGGPCGGDISRAKPMSNLLFVALGRYMKWE